MADNSARAAAPTALRRAYPAQFEIRGKSGSQVGVKGYATVYNRGYEMFDPMGTYTERVREGAGKTTLSQSPRVQLLLNHAGLSMAYTKAGTLRLSEDSTGLQVDADVDTARTDVHDMVLALERGNVDEMSFAFRVTRQEWNEDYTDRQIIEYNINKGDVSVVNFGANDGTEVGLRTEDFMRMSRAARRDLIKRLSVVVVDTDDEGEEDDVPCPSCGEKNADDAMFCDQCGASMGAAQSSTLQHASLGLCLALASAQG